MNTATMSVTDEIREIRDKRYQRRLAQSPREIEQDEQKALDWFEKATGRPIKWGKPE